jgi:hypothetical protein
MIYSFLPPAEQALKASEQVEMSAGDAPMTWSLLKVACLATACPAIGEILPALHVPRSQTREHDHANN